MGGMVIIGHKSSKSTFGTNNFSSNSVTEGNHLNR